MDDLFHDEEEECSDFECPACLEELDDDGRCPTEECEHFECDPFSGGGAHWDDAAEERRQMGITG